MADKKMTKREIFTAAIAVLNQASESNGWDVAEIVSGLAWEIRLLDKKRASASGDAKKKAEQDAYKARILDTLARNSEPMKATEIATDLGTSVQRVTALIKQMTEVGTVIRSQVKKDVFFSLAK